MESSIVTAASCKVKDFPFMKISCPLYGNLADLLKKNKQMEYSTSEFKIDSTTFIIAMIRGFQDRVLIKLGKECGFPRGFPILWRPATDTLEEKIWVYGFFPKFDNDDKSGDLSEFTENTAIMSTYKYSGYLVGICPFIHNEKPYIFMTSKNSACSDSEFVINAKRIFLQNLTVESLTFMSVNSLYAYGECLSLSDEKHGHLIEKETLIITLIGRVGNGTGPSFVEYLPHTERVQICKDLGFYCDGYYEFPPENMKVFLETLHSNRDIAEFDSVDGILQRGLF